MDALTYPVKNTYADIFIFMNNLWSVEFYWQDKKV